MSTHAFLYFVESLAISATTLNIYLILYDPYARLDTLKSANKVKSRNSMNDGTKTAAVELVAAKKKILGMLTQLD